MSKVILLSQGKKQNILEFSFLKNHGYDLIALTYDEEIEQSKVKFEVIYAPNTSWAQGRNILLERAKNKKSYCYYIFFDDDIQFIAGNFIDFINKTLQEKPDFAVPLCDTIKAQRKFYKDVEIQRPLSIDQIIQAYSLKVVNDSIAIPYNTEYDELSWFYSCEINQLLTLSFYNGLQFNDIEIFNGNHYNSKDHQSIYNNKELNQQKLIQIGKDLCEKFKEHPHIDELKNQIQARWHKNYLQSHLKRLTLKIKAAKRFFLFKNAKI